MHLLIHFGLIAKNEITSFKIMKLETTFYFFIRWPSSTLALPPQQYGNLMIKIMKTMIFLHIIIIHIIINGIIIIC